MCGSGVISSFSIMSSYQYTRSAVVSGSPSDHFMPLRMRPVKTIRSSDMENSASTLGSALVRS